MIFDRIELKDHDYGTVKKSSKVRKIKFKSVSFQNISRVWNNFRLKQLDKKLERAKEKTLNMEFGMGSFDRKTGEEMSKAESMILRKTTAIAKLEAKINFLQFGTEVTDDFVSSRAIKIKDNMMKNMRYNANAAYSIPDDKKAEIFAVEEPTTEDVIAAAKKGVDDALNRIMKKKPVTPAKETTSQEAETAPVIKAPTKEEIRKTVDEMFAEEQKRREQATEVSTETVVEQEQATEASTETVVEQEEVREEVKKGLDKVEVTPTVGKKEVAETIDTELGKIDVVPTVKKDDVADTIQDELSKIVVTKNQSNKVNPYINEDGTYRMKKEDIDDDFRVTRVAMSDREKRIEDMRNQHLTVQTAFVRSMQLIKENLDKQAEEEKKQAAAKEEKPVIPAEPVAREMPEVAPVRTPVEEVKALTAAVDKATTKDDLASIMESVTRLQKEQAAAKSREAEIAANEKALKAEKTKAVEELLAYQASLQADIQTRTQGLTEREAHNNAMAQEIDSIRQVMGRR